LSSNGYFPMPLQQPNQLSVKVEGAKLKITSVLPLTSPALLNYLNQRAIATKLVQQYCVQLKYRFEQRDYFGIGFSNLSGGYEIRNPFYKYSSAPKDISVFKNGGETISVFEGFMDFLAFLSVKDREHQAIDFLVLNGIGFFERARYIMEDYKKISLYLDRDKAGMETTQKALSISPLYEDRSKGYSNFKDVNEWAVHLKERPHCKISRRLR
ncbi:toprim domain-containing protein, partial [Arcticibacter sp.]|uniref:toprim domain-containing protein n=1 Tax=Arcticibacter sp. TaxID=1872630 RepID=UPI00388EBDFF